MVGLQYTKDESLKTSETPTLNPWRFSLQVEPGLKYSENRGLIEALDTLDRNNAEVISLGDNANLRWLFRYQGQMDSVARGNIKVATFTGNNLVLTTLPAVGSATVMFEPNDLIQIVGHPHPFTVQERVVRGTGSTVTVTTHRPNVITDSVANANIVIGPTCQFNMKCVNMPTYRLIPGGYLINTGEVINNALIEFSDEFQFYEVF